MRRASQIMSVRGVLIALALLCDLPSQAQAQIKKGCFGSADEGARQKAPRGGHNGGFRAGSDRCRLESHYAVNVADLQCDFFELTDIQHGGETSRRVPVVGGGIMMGICDASRRCARGQCGRRCSGSLESWDITVI
jgi:hypothetical protein